MHFDLHTKHKELMQNLQYKLTKKKKSSNELNQRKFLLKCIFFFFLLSKTMRIVLLHLGKSDLQIRETDIPIQRLLDKRGRKSYLGQHNRKYNYCFC